MYGGPSGGRNSYKDSRAVCAGITGGGTDGVVSVGGDRSGVSGDRGADSEKQGISEAGKIFTALKDLAVGAQHQRVLYRMEDGEKYGL